MDVVRSLRGWSQVPVLVLSGRLDSRQKVAALDAGADDYVTKPFGMPELLARIRAAVRRAATSPGDLVCLALAPAAHATPAPPSRRAANASPSPAPASSA